MAAQIHEKETGRSETAPDDGDFEEDIPSRRISLLQALVGSEITALKRYSWDRPEEMGEEYGLEASAVFSQTAGPLLMTLRSGLTVGFGYIPALASVSVWTERTADGRHKPFYPIVGDEELFPVDAADPTYSREAVSRMIGQRIASVCALQIEPGNAKLAGCPREACLRIQVEDGSVLALCDNLLPSPDDFCVLTGDEVPPAVAAGLKELFRLEAAESGRRER